VHPNSRHRVADCREIIKLVRRVGERSEQSSKDVSPPTTDQARRKLTKRPRLWRDETSATSRPRGT
jgi:hypothetical protein